MLIGLAVLALLAVGAAFYAKRQEMVDSPLIDWIIGALCLAALAILIPSVFMGSDNPAPGTDFEQAAAWKLGELVSSSRDEGEVVVFLDGVLKGTASHSAQRSGISQALGGKLNPVWVDLAPDGGGEFGELDGESPASKRGKAIYDAVKGANQPVAVISMVPLTEHIPKALLDNLPLIFTYEQNDNKTWRDRVEGGEYGAVVMPRGDTDYTKKAASNLQKRFDQRFQVVR